MRIIRVMHPALSVVIATSLGWSAPDVRDLQAADLLVETFAAAVETAPAPSDAAPGTPDLLFARPLPPPEIVVPVPAPPALRDVRAEITYDWRLPVFRTKP